MNHDHGMEGMPPTYPSNNGTSGMHPHKMMMMHMSFIWGGKCRDPLLPLARSSRRRYVRFSLDIHLRARFFCRIALALSADQAGSSNTVGWC
ncbi:hypothetical protein F3Y22_tig00110879pilonHSYRG00022 [Hibiscus syriacus]|uniref:Uncharacterized protein n=1 Tax=Hibiscus syriacus TaxID=106335 RepID=A0A6A2ZJN1_HIBSY|nr:hypothetical protein F3Y22_tig00110879pilonHSYRG00022 [Hibiscus syriacus]